MNVMHGYSLIIEGSIYGPGTFALQVHDTRSRLLHDLYTKGCKHEVYKTCSNQDQSVYPTHTMTNQIT